jgi:hypothetical protein
MTSRVARHCTPQQPAGESRRIIRRVCGLGEVITNNKQQEACEVQPNHAQQKEVRNQSSAMCGQPHGEPRLPHTRGRQRQRRGAQRRDAAASGCEDEQRACGAQAPGERRRRALARPRALPPHLGLKGEPFSHVATFRNWTHTIPSLGNLRACLSSSVFDAPPRHLRSRWGARLAARQHGSTFGVQQQHGQCGSGAI